MSRPGFESQRDGVRSGQSAALQPGSKITCAHAGLID
jgi:hypothetical protein